MYMVDSASSARAGVVSTDGNILIQDAQLETGDIATDYIPTTTTAVSVGPVSNLPRLDYPINADGSVGCPSLLLEPQRTNVITFSEQFDNAAYTKTNVSVTANTSVSPDGYTNADTILSTAASPRLLSPTFTFGAATNVSIFVKYVSQQFVQLFGAGAFGDFANFDIQNATLGTSGASTANAKIENYGNGWLRISATFSGFAGNTTARIGFTASSSAGWNDLDTAFSKSVLAYGFQAEVGAYATSYIPTLGASVTRVADACSKTGISSLIGQTEGTLFLEITTTNDITTVTPIGISDGTGSNRVLLYVGSGVLNALVTVLNVTQVSIFSGAISANTSYKMAIAYKANDFAFYVNGVLVGTDTSGTVPACSKFSYDNGPGTAPFYGLNNQALLFKTRLTNQQLQELTSL
jgi:hypothetical protein